MELPNGDYVIILSNVNGVIGNWSYEPTTDFLSLDDAERTLAHHVYEKRL